MANPRRTAECTGRPSFETFWQRAMGLPNRERWPNYFHGADSIEWGHIGWWQVIDYNSLESSIGLMQPGILNRSYAVQSSALFSGWDSVGICQTT